MTADFALTIPGGQCRFGRRSELLGSSESVGSGWDPFFPAVRAAGVRTRHRCLFESVDMSVIADHRPSPIGSEMVRQIASLRPAEIVLIENCEFNAY